MNSGGDDLIAFMEIWIPKLLGTDTKKDEIRVKGILDGNGDFNNVRKQVTLTFKMSSKRWECRHFQKGKGKEKLFQITIYFIRAGKWKINLPLISALKKMPIINKAPREILNWEIAFVVPAPCQGLYSSNRIYKMWQPNWSPIQNINNSLIYHTLCVPGLSRV